MGFSKKVQTKFSSIVPGVNNIDKFLDELKDFTPALGIEIRMKDTVQSRRPIKMGRTRRKKDGSDSDKKVFYYLSKKSESRDAKQNAIILNKQISEGRNPMFIHPSDAQKIQAKLTERMRAWYKSGRVRYILKDFKDSVGPLFIKAIQNNIRLERSSSDGKSFGSPKPLDPDYREAKNKFYGKVPILDKTHNLMKSFVYKVKLLKFGKQK